MAVMCEVRCAEFAQEFRGGTAPDTAQSSREQSVLPRPMPARTEVSAAWGEGWGEGLFSLAPLGGEGRGEGQPRKHTARSCRSMFHLLCVAMLVTTVLSSVSAQPAGLGGAPPPPPVRVAEAERRALAPTVSVPGTVTSRFDARIAAEVTGRLVSVAEVGTAIPRDGVVARIDDTQLRLQLAEFEAVAERETGRLAFLNREVERLAALVADNIASPSDYERAVNDRDITRADLAIQQARLAQLNDQLERTEIRAPFAGVVAERLRQAGERVAVGDTVVRLTSPSDLEIVARAPLSAVPFLTEGTTLMVSMDGRRIPATIRSLVPFGDVRSHLFEIRLDLPAKDNWKAGQAVRVAVPTDGEREVIAVPRDALVLRRDGAAVFRVNKDGLAERLPVLTGASDGLMIEVQGVVRDGDRIVVRGAERLRTGQAVQVLED
jgi:RND family efflux transporter MFP subunit